jgi:hypothetical protein
VDPRLQGLAAQLLQSKLFLNCLDGVTTGSPAMSYR